jgi:hypothetical protein
MLSTAYFSKSQSDRRFLVRISLSLDTCPIAPRRISPDTTAKRPTLTTLATFNPLAAKSLSLSCTISSKPAIYWRVCDETIQINQSSYSPGSFCNKSAGRSLPSSRSVWGNRNNTICPACFMQKRPLNQRDCTSLSHLLCHAWQMIMTEKSIPVSLVVRLSWLNTEYNQEGPLDKSKVNTGYIGGFFRQVSWFLPHQTLDYLFYLYFTPISTR